jgi:hypothetical protein
MAANLAGTGAAAEALGLVEEAVALLPQAGLRTLIRADQEHAAAKLASFPGEIAAVAVAAGRPGRAVELLEQTRGILVADILDARSSDLPRLRERLPALAAQFAGLRDRVDALNQGGIAAQSASGAQALARQRRETYAAWDDLIARIRSASGFGDFLQPPDIRKLAEQAADGPVIFTYASESGCGAVVLTGDPGDPVRAISLQLTEDEAFRQAERLLNVLEADADRPGSPAGQAEVHDVLGWMWDAIAGPILTRLGYTDPPAAGRPWPRVWWCPVGVLAYLPLHAAGHHADSVAGLARPRAVLDLVISSYATTLRGLAYSRAHRPQGSADATLIVAASAVPGLPPLAGTKHEVEILTGLMPGAKVLTRPTRDTVLAALPACRATHFACHGYASSADPAASHLVLYDHETSPLTVADISSLQLTGGLAYLSACETAVGSLELADEAVHLTGAFHLAGYRQVIGTLWPIGDDIAAGVARDFYRQLTDGGTRPPETGLASHALHNAVRRLRRRLPDYPGHWAPYTHTGS